MQNFDPVNALAKLRRETGEHDGVNMSIEASTTFSVHSAHTLPELFHGDRGPNDAGGGCYFYGRHFNPTVHALGDELAAIEGTEAAYCTSSGMSAIAVTILQSCGHGDHIVASDTLYGGTFALLKDFLPVRANIKTTFVDIDNTVAVEAAFKDRTKLLYVETMSNPTLAVADIPKLAQIAHRHGASMVVDNTFCPMIVSPARLGADVVIHSLTKFINGASDIIAGVVCGDKNFVGALMNANTGAAMLLGPTMDPKMAFEISLRLPHLGLRIKEHSRRALILCERLEQEEVKVIYPGLRSHPHHNTLDNIRNAGFGYGGIFGIDLETEDRAYAFIEQLQNKRHFGFIAVSLGYFDTLMSVSASSTSSELSEEDKKRAGISPGLVRVAIGYTGSIEERWTELKETFEEMKISK